MNTYTPDCWVVLEITDSEETTQKVFAGWYGGGFTGSDSWKLNSGIKATRKLGNWFEFDGYSGSTYRCNTKSYRLTGLMHNVLASWRESFKEYPDVKIRVLKLDEVTL
jgi:hypothetical protein